MVEIGLLLLEIRVFHLVIWVPVRSLTNFVYFGYFFRTFVLLAYILFKIWQNLLEIWLFLREIRLFLNNPISFFQVSYFIFTFFSLRNGRWRSVWTVQLENGQAEVSSVFKVQVHYFEDGNVQLVSSKEIKEEISFSVSTFLYPMWFAGKKE